jgi:hypothetical protein
LQEDVGTERSLGSVYYVEGGFHRHDDYIAYNKRAHTAKARYTFAMLYSYIVEPMYDLGIAATGIDLTTIISTYRYDLQHHENSTSPSFQNVGQMSNIIVFVCTSRTNVKYPALLE